jgi:hypothetical protein
MAESGISAGRARLHEALVLKLEALLDELRPLAARHPEGAVGPALRATAEALLYEAARFRPRRRREVFPAAAPTLGALAVELGQARAGLEAFELTHSAWSPKHKAFLWHVAGTPLPVARLRARADIADRAQGRAESRLRRDLVRQVRVKIEDAYEQGYDDARQGRPQRTAEAGIASGFGPRR